MSTAAAAPELNATPLLAGGAGGGARLVRDHARRHHRPLRAGDRQSGRSSRRGEGRRRHRRVLRRPHPGAVHLLDPAGDLRRQQSDCDVARALRPATAKAAARQGKMRTRLRAPCTSSLEGSRTQRPAHPRHPDQLRLPPVEPPAASRQRSRTRMNLPAQTRTTAHVTAATPGDLPMAGTAAPPTRQATTWPTDEKWPNPRDPYTVAQRWSADRRLSRAARAWRAERARSSARWRGSCPRRKTRRRLAGVRSRWCSAPATPRPGTPPWRS